MKHSSEHEEHMDETWLIPYADLLTLLLALFIVLFATSTADQELLDSMKEAFYKEYTGVLPEPETGEIGNGEMETGESGNEGVDTEDEQVSLPEKPIETDKGEGEGEAESLISTLEQEFTSYIEANGLQAEIKVQAQMEGLLVTLTSDVWFASGSAEINSSMKEVAAQISNMISKIQNDSQMRLSVIVSGHTDNVPISGSEFPDNWWLSVTRAVNFMQELMKSSSLGPSNFSARGFGEFEPISSNDTPEGRQQNRRVEVMISPRMPDTLY